MLRHLSIAAIFLVSPVAAAAPEGILADVPLPAGYALNPDAEVVAWSVHTFNVGEQAHVVEGPRATAAAHAEPPTGVNGPTALAQWTGAFAKAGWQVDQKEPNLIARKSLRGTEAWIDLWAFAGDDVRFTLVEKAARTTTLALEPPRADATRTPRGADFPFLAHFPGAKLTGAGEAGGFDAAKDGEAEAWVGPSITRDYQFPKPIGVHEFVAVYQEALAKAGWEIVKVAEPSDGVLVAHYAKDGHDVWAYLHAGGGEAGYAVVNVGAAAAASKLAEELKKKGHVALYGIYFDVDSAKLKPESDATLAQVVALLQADPALRLEIQGHTDATGARPHNQTLSEQRAASVVAYLTKAGVEASRLTSAGYADTRPVATNESPEGRALNRRVELSRRK